MEEKYLYVDVYLKNGSKLKWLTQVEDIVDNIKTVNGPYGNYWTLKVKKKYKRKVSSILQKSGVKQSWYLPQWTRSSDYRKTFYKHNPGPYRCRYCNKRLKKDYIQIDHIFPVGKTKRDSGLRTRMYMLGIRDVNDPRNLVAACNKCNKKKSDKGGLWIVKGLLGYWRYKIFMLLMMIILLLAACMLLDRVGCLDDVEYFVSYFCQNVLRNAFGNVSGNAAGSMFGNIFSSTFSSAIGRTYGSAIRGAMINNSRITMIV